METWAERRKEILNALSQLATTQLNPAESNLFLHQTILRCIQLETAQKEFPPTLRRIASNSLKIDDFLSLSTLSTSGPFNRVELVTPASTLTRQPLTSAKCFVIKTVDRRWAFRMRQQQSVAHEIAVLRLSNSSSSSSSSESSRIPHLIASFLSPSSIHLVLSHASGGDLWTLLESSLVVEKDPDSLEGLPEEWVRYWMAELLDCIEWLHSQGWAHRDIKPHNLLLVSSGHLQLTDFGSSSPLSHSSSVSKKYALALVGTPDYIAPEILRYAETIAEESQDFDSTCWKESEEERAYGMEVDLWSVGIVVYELLFGKAPFFAEEIAETYERIINFKKYLTIPETASKSEEARDLISKLLVEPEERPPISTLKRHPWFQNIDWSHLRSTPPPHTPPLFTTPSLSPSSNSPSQSNASASFTTFSQSFFSSPGLSILRPSPSTLEGARKEERNYWEALEMGGLTTLARANAFEPSSSDSSETSRSIRPVTSSPPLGKLVHDFSRFSYSTPARSVKNRFERVGNGSNPPPSSARSRRLISDVEAWKEMQEHAWEVGVSAKKTRSLSARKGVKEVERTGEVESSKGNGSGNELGKLERRHGEFVKELEEIGKKYGKLFELAEREKKSGNVS